MRIRRRRVWLLLAPLVALGAWFVWGVALDAASMQVYQVPSKSMSPTIAPGDRIFVETRASDPPRRGEIWVFRMKNGTVLVKRVIGLPGESIEVAGGRVRVDGRAIDEPYVAAPATYAMPALTLGPSEYFVLGDNRNTSNDSHNWGPLDEGQFLGRVMFRPWPPSRIGGLR